MLTPRLPRQASRRRLPLAEPLPLFRACPRPSPTYLGEEAGAVSGMADRAGGLNLEQQGVPIAVNDDAADIQVVARSRSLCHNSLRLRLQNQAWPLARVLRKASSFM